MCACVHIFDIHTSLSHTCSGCKVYLRLYLNGDGSGKGTHISLFINCDSLLRRPFKRKIALTLIGKCTVFCKCLHKFRTQVLYYTGQNLNIKININWLCLFLADQKQRRPDNISRVLKPAALQLDNSQSEMNIAYGFPMFAKQTVLDSNSYIHNDCICLRCSA